MAMDYSAKNIQKLKIVLLGNSGVGKTSLINQYVNKKFHHKGTLDFQDVVNKEVEADGKHAILQIQDTRGKERLGTGLEATFFSNAHGCMLVYDVNDPQSLDNLESWHNEFVTRVISPADPKRFPFIVLGNKVDLDGGKSIGVSERARMWCQSKGPIYHLMTSAKENKNVIEAFQFISDLAINNETTKKDVTPRQREHENTKVEEEPPQKEASKTKAEYPFDNPPMIEYPQVIDPSNVNKPDLQCCTIM